MDDQIHAQLVYSSARDFLLLARKELDSFNEIAVKESDTPFIRRTKVRVLFAVIEAHVFHLQTITYAASKRNPKLFTDQESLLLQGLRRNDKGELQNAKDQLKKRIRFAFAAFSRALGKKHIVDFGTDGGQRFASAITIRDRITHPKIVSSWTINDEDSKNIDAAWEWFEKHLAEVSKIDA